MLKKVELHSHEHFTFSTYVVAGDFIYTSHIGGIYNDEGNKLETIEGQTRQTLKNLQEVLANEDVTLNDVVKTTVWLKDLSDFGAMRDVYRDYFTDGYPARMSATTDFIEPSCLIMIEAVAFKQTRL